MPFAVHATIGPSRFSASFLEDFLRQFITIRVMGESLASEVDVEEPSKEIYFCYSATLRIFGSIPHLDEVSERLGVSPTHTHRREDRRGPHARPYPHDMWMYEAPVPENQPLHIHIDSLWSILKDRKHDLLELKNQLTIDVFLGYRSNSDTAGLEVPPASLEMFIELQVPFALSIIVS